MLRFGETKVTNEKFYVAKWKPIKIWIFNVDNIVISKVVKTNTNSKYLTGYLDKVIRPLVLLMPKMSRNVQIFKFDFKNIELIALPVCDDRYIKTKIRTYTKTNITC